MTTHPFGKLLMLVSLVAVLMFGWWAIVSRSQDALVVYCAHDLVFAEQVLQDFEAETGIKVVVVGDTEATKSLGLVQRLIREREHPQCDVFWNNQLLGTIALADQGVLQPYKGTGYERMPDRFKDSNGLWTGFAGRLRVWIVNTEKFSGDESELEARLNEGDLSRMAIAMPMYGTTLSHFSILWGVWGEDTLKQWYADIQARNCRIVPGNSTVKNLVSEGVCDFGWTDTDDFFVGLDAGHPVEMLPIRVHGQTLCLPNSVAMIAGTKRFDEAAQLIDYLLTERVELQLARSEARQIPLGPTDLQQLPAEVQPLYEWAQAAIDVREFAQARTSCLTWLQSLHTESLR